MDTVNETLVPCQDTMRTIYKMGLLFLMYIAQKIFLCFSWTLIPIILRKQGVSLGIIGFTALVYSPWSLKFLYAFVVDRFYSSRMGRRKSWIVPLLAASAALLPVFTVISPEKNWGLLLAAVFLMNVIFATTDIAVDGYATDILNIHERPMGNTVQMIAYMIGYMLGAGIFLILYETKGWLAAIWIASILQVALIIPVLLHREIPPAEIKELNNSGIRSSEAPIGTWSFIVQEKTLWFLLFSILVTVADRGGSQLYLPMFVDRGINPVRLGQVNLWVGAPMSILGSILGGLMVSRLGVRKVFTISCLSCAGIKFFSAAVSRTLLPGYCQIGILLGADKLVVGVVFVLIYHMVMSFSAGPRSATHYAALCSLPHLFGLAIMPLIGSVGDCVGYFKLYVCLGAFSLFFLFAGRHVLRYRLELE